MGLIQENSKGVKMQDIYKCENYTKNENLNKTCEGKTRCIIYYDEYCYKFKDKTNTHTPHY